MKEALTDTIAAVSTAEGPGGVGIIRISGPRALEAALRLFHTVEGIRERYFHLGTIAALDGSAIDRGFLVYMKGPRSYTGEDVVELHCHGGPLILRKVLSEALFAGARAAEPGEFTKRAFLAGKLDLSQAEAVADIIRAQTELSLSSARGRLEGSLSRKVASIKAPLVEILARVEAELDFPEEEIDAIHAEDLEGALKAVSSSIDKMLSTFEEGRAIREGARVLILGRPNAGKSSLLNVLLEEERAIVTDTPGTTRDVIEEAGSIRGMPVRLMDTAGLRESMDEGEAIGVRRAREKAAHAGLILYIVDLAGPFEEDRAFLKELWERKIIIVGNKKDLPQADELGAKEAFSPLPVAAISALREEGIEELKDLIFSQVAGHDRAALSAPPGELVASVRHRDCLMKSKEALARASAALFAALPRELLATDMRLAIDALGEITGETTTADILDVVFSAFCIGK